MGKEKGKGFPTCWAEGGDFGPPGRERGRQQGTATWRGPTRQ
jgi:hypothetical protein